MRNLAKGFFSMVLVVALLLGGMVGASASEKVEITIGGLDYVYMPMVVEAFNAANPDIHLTYMPDVGNVDDGTLQAVLQSGLGPDIIGTGSGAGRIGPLAKNGLIQPINAIYDEYKLWDRYQPFVVDALKKTVNDGNIYEVLEGLDVFQIYYNIEIFEKVGVEPPKTWDEFTQVCDKLLAAGQDKGRRLPKDGGIQRYKGLGEMNDHELWETTMDPSTRILKKVTLDEAADADETFAILMGDDVEQRRSFIQRNASDVRFLDI